MTTNGKTYTRGELLQRVGRLQQIGGTLRFVLNEGRAKGVEAIEVNTGAGLVFTILPDRGLDICQATYKGTNLVFHTPNGEAHPAFYEPEGMGWLRTFFGGLLTTCGLTYLGQPGKDGDADLGLHGRYTNSPACQVCDRSRWDGDEYLIEVSGMVEECRIFGDKMRMTRTISTQIGSRSVQIHDIVENFGYQSSPFCILYHVNPGFPLLDAASRFWLTAATTSAYDAKSERNMQDMYVFSDPVPGFDEENFLHTMQGDDAGKGHAVFSNPKLNGGLGMHLRFDVSTLPYLNEWKMMGQGDYVVGVEPANVPCLNRAELREKGLLPMLEPGAARAMLVEINVLDGMDEIERRATSMTSDR